MPTSRESLTAEVRELLSEDERNKLKAIERRPIGPRFSHPVSEGEASPVRRRYACPDCGKVFDTPQRLGSHQLHHVRKTCTVCGAGPFDPPGLAHHMEIHDPTRRRGLPEAGLESGDRPVDETGAGAERPEEALAVAAGSGDRIPIQGNAVMADLVRRLFPEGVPADPEVLRRLADYLEQAGQLLTLVPEEASRTTGSGVVQATFRPAPERGKAKAQEYWDRLTPERVAEMAKRLGRPTTFRTFARIVAHAHRMPESRAWSQLNHLADTGQLPSGLWAEQKTARGFRLRKVLPLIG